MAERNRYKITAGEITPQHFSKYDLVFLDKEKNVWQLIMFLGIDGRWRLSGRVFHKWLLFHPNGGFITQNIHETVPIYLDVRTDEP